LNEWKQFQDIVIDVMGRMHWIKLRS